MNSLALQCQNCSAPLDVPISARYVTCSHCGTQLAVKHSGSAAYTETLDQIDHRTERMARQLDQLHEQQTVQALDQQWDIDRQQFDLIARNGMRLPPTNSLALAGSARRDRVWRVVDPDGLRHWRSLLLERAPHRWASLDWCFPCSD